MTQNFVELDRTFHKIGENEDPDPDIPRIIAEMSGNKTGWSELLKYPRIILLAEAGVGKTVETRHRVEKLRENGEVAFWCTIEDLADGGLAKSLDTHDDESRLSKWLTDGNIGYFFLDSVDEARLVRKSFERALRNFSKAIAPALQRVHVVITCRVSDWQANADAATVMRYLPLPAIAESRSDLPDKFEDFDLDSVATKDDAQQDSLSVYQMAPLSSDQITKFASAIGTPETSTFLAAIDDADAWAFARRPLDLLNLAAYWSENRKLGTLTELIEFDVNAKLSEDNPRHKKRGALSTTEAVNGAMALAAALHFCRKNSILVPDQPVDPARRADAVDPMEVLLEWSAENVEALCGRAIFDEATYGRVRFHHRAARDFLTARWIEARLKEGYPRREIERLLFCEKYGQQIAVPSMRPISAWLANWDEPIRKLTYRIAPELLIEGGDPAVLPLDDRAALVRRFADHYGDRSDTGASFDLQAVKRFSSPDLGPVIIELFDRYPNHRDVKELLLRMVYHGRVEECAELGLEIAINPKEDLGVRLFAIRAAVAAGTKTQRNKLVSFAVANRITEKGEIIGAICQECVPNDMGISSLLEITSAAPINGGHSGWSLPYTLPRISESKCPISDLDDLLLGLLHLAESKPYIKEPRKERISRNFAWLAESVGKLTARIMNEIEGSEESVKLVTRACEFLARCQGAGLERQHQLKDVSLALTSRRDVVRALFWNAVKSARKQWKTRRVNVWQVERDYDLWSLGEEDFEWLAEDVKKSRTQDNKFAALTAAFYLWNASGREADGKLVLKEAVARSKMLRKELDLLIDPPPRKETKVERKSRLWDQGMRKKMEANKRANRRAQLKWRSQLEREHEELRAGNNFSDLYHLARLIGQGSGGNRWGHGDWRILMLILGESIAEAARDGLMRSWRVYIPKLPHESENPMRIEYGVITGLTGLAIEAIENPDWVKEITPAEAELAARYATLELNGFPEWFSPLAFAHEKAVTKVIKEALMGEIVALPDEEPSHNVIYSIAYGSDEVRNLFFPIILGIMEKSKLTNSANLEYILRALLGNEEIDSVRLVNLAEKLTEASKGDQPRYLAWLVAWFCVDAENALSHVEKELRVLPPTKSDGLIFDFCNTLLEHGERRFGHKVADYERTDILRRLIPIVYGHVRIEDDIHRIGSSKAGVRDNAARTRGFLLERLCNTPGEGTYDALITFSNLPQMEMLRDRLLNFARARAAADAEFEDFQAQDIHKIETKHGKQLTTVNELFDVVCDRIDDIKYYVEGGDFSLAGPLWAVAEEKHLQRFLAGRLRESSRGQYSTTREEEVIDRKMPDIRLHCPGVAGRVTIETKVADNSTGPKLMVALEEQLVGQYLRDEQSCHGLYVLGYYGRKKSWRLRRHGASLDFSRLIGELKQHADQVAGADPRVERLAVMGIDFRSHE